MEWVNFELDGNVIGVVDTFIFIDSEIKNEDGGKEAHYIVIMT